MHNAPDDYLQHRNPCDDDQPEPTWEGLDYHQQDEIIKKLVKLCDEDDQAMVWTCTRETRVVSTWTAARHIAEDVDKAHEVVKAEITGDDIGEKVLGWISQIISDDIYEAMHDYGFLPDGINWSDVL